MEKFQKQSCQKNMFFVIKNIGLLRLKLYFFKTAEMRERRGK